MEATHKMARIKLRRDTAANWNLADPVLDLGEPGFETDTNKMKIGNGVDEWTALNYFSGGPNSNITDTVVCPPSIDTVVYTSSEQYEHTIKLLVEVEGVEGNVAGSEPGDWDTQSCEIMVAKSFRNNTVVASVYGVTYTSIAVLATFTADWDVGLNRVEIKCQPISTVNNVYVRVSSLSIPTSD